MAACKALLALLIVATILAFDTTQAQGHGSEYRGGSRYQGRGFGGGFTFDGANGGRFNQGGGGGGRFNQGGGGGFNQGGGGGFHQGGGGGGRGGGSVGGGYQ